MDFEIPYKDIVGNKIKEVKGLRYSFLKTFVSMTLSLFVLGLPFIFAAFKPKLLVMFCYIKATTENMSHIYIAFSDGFEEICEVKRENERIHNKTSFVIRNARYFVNKAGEKPEIIEQAKYPIFTKTYGEVIDSMKGGLKSLEDYWSMEELYGKNTLLLSVEQKFVKIITKEFRNPFMVQLIFSLLFSVISLAFTFFALILGSLVFYFGYLIYSARVKYRKVEKAFMEGLPNVKVIRSKKEIEVSAAETVVGDLVNLTSNENQPIFFDCLVISGHAVVSEASLTGESNPIYKGPPKNLREKVNKKSLESSMILAGSILFEARNQEPKEGEDDSTYALVINTGFNSQQGEVAKLAAISQFPAYSVDLYRILIFMSVLVVPYMIATFYLSTKEIDSFFRRVAFWNIMFQSVYSISIILIQPILLSIVNKGLAKKEGVQTSNINHILKCKRVSFICFDKTGTLTENDQKLHYVAVPSTGHKPMIKETPSETSEGYKNILADHPLVSILMGTCHSLTQVKEFMVGDNIETGMFYSSGWKYIEKGVYGLEGMDQARTEVAKIYPFSPEIQTMSVCVKNEQIGNYGLVKGSPEKIRSILKGSKMDEAVEAELQGFFSDGFRVIAMAGKPLKSEIVSREELESDLAFFGFLVFENPLKPETVQTIETLHKCNIRECMITGDNVLTGIECAQKAGLIEKKWRVFTADWNEDAGSLEFFVHLSAENEFEEDKGNNSGPQKLIEMQNVNEMNQQLLPQSRHSNLFDMELVWNENVCFALSGSTFNFVEQWVRQHQEEEKNYLEFLAKCKVFGRAKPTDKSNIVKEIRRIYEPRDIYVAYVGDGINDCGAYLAADTSVSLGTGSMALISNFSTEKQNISYLFPIMKEGRAAGFMLLALVSYGLLLNVMFATFFLFELTLGIAANGFWPMVLGTWPLYQLVSFFYIKSEKEIIEILPPRYLINTKWIIFFTGYLTTYIAFNAALFYYFYNGYKQDYGGPISANPVDTLNNIVLDAECLIAYLVCYKGRPFYRSLWNFKCGLYGLFLYPVVLVFVFLIRTPSLMQMTKVICLCLFSSTFFTKLGRPMILETNPWLSLAFSLPT